MDFVGSGLQPLFPIAIGQNMMRFGATGSDDFIPHLFRKRSIEETVLPRPRDGRRDGVFVFK
jgi:hypothetical protein